MLSRDDDEYRKKCSESFLLGLRDLANEEHQNAVKQFEEAIEYQGKIVANKNDNDRRGVARCYYLLGLINLRLYSERAMINLAWMLSDLPQIKEQFERAITLLGEIEIGGRTDEDNHDMALNYFSLGKIYLKMNDWQKALECNNEAVVNFGYVKAGLNDDSYREVANIHRSSGDACQHLGAWANASTHYNKAITNWKKISESLSDQEYTELATCYHQAGLVMKKQNEQEIARAYFLSEVDMLGRVKIKTEEILGLIHKAYVELRDNCPENDTEREIFLFAAEAFGASFFNSANYEKLNNSLYLFTVSPNWHTARICESFTRLLELICGTCRLPVFPGGALKRYLQDDNHFDVLQKKLRDIKNRKSGSVDNVLYELQDRVHRLEQDNLSLRSDVTELRKKLETVSSPGFFKPVNQDVARKENDYVCAVVKNM
jgi:tetratricopeptide (TPR) repeat protein